jgi:hypothetical protein
MAHRAACASTAGRRATGPATVRTAAKVAGGAKDASRAGAAAKAAGQEVRCLRLALCNDILFFFFYLAACRWTRKRWLLPRYRIYLVFSIIFVSFFWTSITPAAQGVKRRADDDGSKGGGGRKRKTCLKCRQPATSLCLCLSCMCAFMCACDLINLIGRALGHALS